MIRDAIQGIVESEFLSGAFLLSIFAGIIFSLKSILKVVWQRIERKLVYTVKIEQTDDLFLYLERWLIHHHEKEYRSVIAHIGDIHIPNTKEIQNPSEGAISREEVKYRQENDTILVKFKGSYIKIYKGREKLENASSLLSLYFDHFSISILLFKSKIKCLLEEVIDFNQQFKNESSRRDVYTWDGYHNWNRLTDVRMKSFDQIILPGELKKSLIRDIDLFLGRENWYETKAIPYKRGYLFYGTPGNGKTSISVAMANYLNRSIHTVTISEIMDDASMRSVFRGVKSNSVLLFEDVDAMFKKRKTKSSVSFSTFLNCLDGVFYKHGSIVIMTTNHIELLDPALIRPGRIDFKAEIVNPEFEEVKSYMELFYDRPLDIQKNGYQNPFPMSKIQNFCMGSNEADKVIAEIFN
ncbi:Proteasome-associated ATPase [subsurface metagenome]